MSWGESNQRLVISNQLSVAKQMGLIVFEGMIKPVCFRPQQIQICSRWIFIQFERESGSIETSAHALRSFMEMILIM
jgi:hypothetical protein